MAEQLTYNKEKLIRVFFFSAFAFVLYQLFRLAEPFLTALLLSAMLGMAFFPVYIRLKRWMGHPTLAALLLTTLVFLAAIIPMFWIGLYVIKEADRLLPTVQSFIINLQHADLVELKAKLPNFLQSYIDPALHLIQNMKIDPETTIIRYAGIIGAKITSFGTLMAKNALLTFFNILVLFISLFFVFKDGEALLQWVLSLIPMETSHKKTLAKRAYETFMAVVMGVILTASAQGLTAMFGFWIAGVKLPAILGLLVGMAAFFGASFLVTVPVAISMFQDSTGWGIFLLIWGPIVVGLMDNILKPLLIGSRARMPFVLIFFSIIGGIKAYGILGFIFGPVVVASFLTFVSIYRKGPTETGDRLPPQKEKVDQW